MLEELVVLHDNIAECQACKFLKEHWRFPKETHGNDKASVMLVGESAYRPSIEIGQYYSAGALRSAVSGVVDLEHQFYLTDLVKCDKDYLDTKKYLEVAAQNCYPFLVKEIEFINPKVIIAIGERAFRYLTGLTGNFTARQDDDQRYLYKTIPILPIIHPSYGTVHYGKTTWQDIGYHNSVRKIFTQAISI